MESSFGAVWTAWTYALYALSGGEAVLRDRLIRARRSARFSGGFEFGGFRTPFSKVRAANPDEVVDVVFVVLLSSVAVLDPERDFDRELLRLDLVILLNRRRFSRVSLDGALGS
jgi:hypothetical protein